MGIISDLQWIVIIIGVIVSPMMWLAVFAFMLLCFFEPDDVFTDDVIDECQTIIDKCETIIAENSLNHQADDNAQQVINVSIQDSIVQRSDMCPIFTSK